MGQRIKQRHEQLLAQRDHLAAETEKIETNLRFVESLKKADAIIEEFLTHLQRYPHPLGARFVVVFAQIENEIDQLIDNPQGFHDLKGGIDEMGAYLNRFNAACRTATQPLGLWDKLMQHTVSEKMDEVIQTYLDNDALAALGAWHMAILEFKSTQETGS